MTEIPIFDDSNINRVLCVVAHPDDMEYGGSAAVSKWIDEGKEVAYLLLTRGEAGIRDMSPEEVAPLRAEEQRRACNIVGVDDLEILEFPDGLLEPTHELRRAIARKIREFRPNAVVVTTFDLQVQWGLNHVDHRHAGIATVDAIRDADNPWVFTDLEDEGLEAWKADRLLINGAQPTHAVALTAAHVDRGVRSLEAHKVYLDALSDHPAPKDVIPSIATSGGELAGVDYALPITVVGM